MRTPELADLFRDVPAMGASEGASLPERRLPVRDHQWANVRATERGQQVNVRGPRANPFEGDQKFARRVVGKIVKVIQIQMLPDQRLRDQT
jgi:hypothetical protein